jgi:hypothetical protein
MPAELELFGGSGDAPFSLTELLVNLVIGLVLALVIRWLFLRFGSTLSNRDELGGVLPFVLMTTILNELIGKHVSSSDLRRFDERSDGLDATYLLDISSTASLTSLSNESRSQFPDIGITFLDQNGMPGI